MFKKDKKLPNEKKATKLVNKADKKAESKAKVNNYIVRGSTSASAPVLRVKNLTKKFGDFVALDNVSFDVKRGERIGLIGGNGAGKTTATEIIAGINKPTSGKLEFGFDFVSNPKEGVGMQFQQSTYPSGLTVKDIISFAKNLRKLDLDQKALKELLDVFQMRDFYNRKVRSLSGGQRQKLNILLSIIHNPKLVILDELSTGLDISARENIIKFTDELLKRNNMSAILISHHMAEIKALCSRIILLDNGKVVDDKSVEEIEKKYGSLSEYSRKMIAISNEHSLQIAKKMNKKHKLHLPHKSKAEKAAIKAQHQLEKDMLKHEPKKDKKEKKTTKRGKK